MSRGHMSGQRRFLDREPGEERAVETEAERETAGICVSGRSRSGVSAMFTSAFC